ncbi:MAG: hypothetical protein ACRD2C_00025 [Acidimicrobiales bacterium]
MPTYSHYGPGPFETLEADWALTCRRDRRRRTTERWAELEPVLAGLRHLAEVIPAVDVDRRPIAVAIARLHIDGEDLAGRALLQLFVPGMVRLTAKWRDRIPGGVHAAGWEVVARSAQYIWQLRERRIRSAPAGYVLSSIHRDLLMEATEQQHERPMGIDGQDGGDHRTDPRRSMPSAEDTVCATTGIRDALEAAVAARVLPADSLDVLWLDLSGYTMAEAAELARTTYSPQASYRHRSQTYAYLRRQLFDVPNGEAGQ